jgi:sterol desaturase/sphingolipid hydroxylase (fatty acid hydroxylase superfamily)
MGDLTVAAIPYYFAGMGLEAWAHERRRARTGTVTAGDYEPRDTAASLTMGVASLVAPLVTRPLLYRLDVFRGRAGRVLVGIAGAAAVATVAADTLARAGNLEPGARPEGTADPPDATTDRQPEGTGGEARRRRWGRRVRRVAGSSAVVTVAAAGAAACGTWAARTTARRLWRRRLIDDLGTGVLAHAVAIVGWDFLYYLNHRFMHTSRYMWAIHVVHHSSERYNLSTALRQPVADALGTFVPYGALALLGVRPELIERARGINLIYQFWIHTEAIGRIGVLERWFNSPSHHRVHHGSNRQYLDRNHGGILIVWDKLLGTFEPEDEPVVYGLTTNIDTFHPVRIATHEYLDMARDVAGADTWGDRLSFVFRGPGWALERRRGGDRPRAGTGQPAASAGATSTRPLAAAAANRS